MRFYRDIITDLGEPVQTAKYHYHQWSSDSIKFFWDICTNNPFTRSQFYPIVYWEDLLAWSSQKMTTMPLTIVDVGCGSGNLIECIRKIYRGKLIYGVDLSEQSLKPAKERFKNDRNIQFKVGTLNGLPFEDDSVDLITCTEVLEHTFPETFVHSFSEISRVLKKGGYYLASIPFNEKFAFVCCPECGSVFTPYQHMIFEITHDHISALLSKNNLELIDFYQSLDRSQPTNPAKRVLKPIVIKWLPGFAKRIFPKDGVSGFLARAKTKS
jgi:ubiquinone/menaquinone biosynthesis C-methylase UbiE